MPTTDMTLITHPAGTDEELRLALEDLQMGRWLSSRDLLAATGPDRALRTSRSQVLALYAAQGDAVAAWCAEEPGSGTAIMMRARVLTQRALELQGRHPGHRTVQQAADAAREACRAARERLPMDPVPVVCLLALAQLDSDPVYPLYRDNWGQSSDLLLPQGPWSLLDLANRLDPYNREAYHRVLQCLHTRQGGAVEFARWTARQAPAGSPLLVLPLYAYAGNYWRQTGSHSRRGPIGYWGTEAVQDAVRRARDYWFAPLHSLPPHERPAWSLADLNHLAYVLVKSGLSGRAGEVFRDIGPYATAAPWAQLTESGRWEEDFHRARNFAFSRETADR